jgi:hypothetical protein
VNILFSINCFKSGGAGKSNAGIIWAAAWARFLNKHKDRLPGDFQFLNDGFKESYFQSIVGDFPVIQTPHSFIPSDADQTYECIKQASDKYDYVARVDPDMFPSIEALEKMVEFLEQNPDIDILSPGNTFQAFHNNGYQPYPEQDNNWSHWKYQPVGNCIVFFRKAYVDECLETYRSLKVIENKNRPFFSAHLTYGEACKLLSVPYDEQYKDLIMGMDGQINIDFWTIMCAKGMKQGHIVNDDGRSFECKEQMTTSQKSLVSFEDLKDGIDVAKDFPDANKVRAPFFHVGMSYYVPYHIDVHNNNSDIVDIHREDYLHSFSSNNEYGMRAYHCALIKELLLSLGDQTLIDAMNASISKTLKILNQSEESFDALSQHVRSYYKNALKDYI